MKPLMRHFLASEILGLKLIFKFQYLPIFRHVLTALAYSLVPALPVSAAAAVIVLPSLFLIVFRAHKHTTDTPHTPHPTCARVYVCAFAGHGGRRLGKSKRMCRGILLSLLPLVDVATVADAGASGGADDVVGAWSSYCCPLLTTFDKQQQGRIYKQPAERGGAILIRLCLSWQITHFLCADIIINVLQVIHSKRCRADSCKTLL